MIKIQNLVKIYKSKKTRKHMALNNLNVDFPDKGLVFVLGKSGSGKSTLLNLIGGLDSITKGTIEVDGNELSKFKEKDYCNYRNTHIGFIFQDYHLIDELTVYENIALSLNLKQLDDNNDIKNALKKVDLANYENRYPSELSGGERQRVAIARAIVKNPRIILADEPTGNLDTKTSLQIIKLLKEISKNCLIIIVSHNTIDAYNYGDRIIELQNGKIIQDLSRNSTFNDELTIKDNILYYPKDKVLNEDDVSLLNERRYRKIVRVNDKYIKTELKNQKANKRKIDNKDLLIKDESKLSFTFLKSKLLRIFFSSFMTAVLLVILALAQTIITFDAGQIIADEMNKRNQNSLVLSKNLTEKQQEEFGNKFYSGIPNDDLEQFKNTSYNGKIYEVLNYSVPLFLTGKGAGIEQSLFNNIPYLNETLGTMIVDEEFIINKFGKLEYLAKASSFHPSGVIITDYAADILKIANVNCLNKSYDDIIGDLSFSVNYGKRAIINGIINTNYKEKYKSLFELVSQTKPDQLSEISSNEEFASFTDDLYSGLGMCFTFNKNFKQSFVENYPMEIIWHYRLNINGKTYIEDEAPQIQCVTRAEYQKFNLTDNEIVFSYQDYNEIFGTEYTISTLDTFVPHKIDLKQYYYFDIDEENLLYSKELYIKKIYPTSNATIVVSEEVFNEMKVNALFTKWLYFEGNERLNVVMDKANELGYTQKMYVIEGIHTMTKAVDVFIPIFELIALVLCGGIVFILVSFSTKMIKDKMHNIGILKALGSKNKTILTIFGLQIILIAILTFIMFAIGYYFFIDLANDVLISSLKELAPGHIVLDLDFLVFKPYIVLIDLALISILSIVSLFGPFMLIRRIKPVQIIKAKE